MKQLDVLWKGDLPLESLNWKFDSTAEISFSKKLKEKIEDFWLTTLQQYPSLYNGTLLCLHKIDYKPNKIDLVVGFVQFKTIFYHYKKKIPLKVSYGSTGFQAIIYNPARTHILLGIRAPNSDYKPGYLTLPGGIFEKIDLEGSIIKACQREILEETNLETKNESFKLLSLVREENNVATVVLVETETTNEIEVETNSILKTKGNEEWANNELTWYPISRLRELHEKPMLEGLSILINGKR